MSAPDSAYALTFSSVTGPEISTMTEGDKLRAWDVKTDGVGLVENYRTMFNKIIAKDGFDGLIAKMKKKQAASGT